MSLKNYEEFKRRCKAKGARIQYNDPLKLRGEIIGRSLVVWSVMVPDAEELCNAACRQEKRSRLRENEPLCEHTTNTHYHFLFQEFYE